MMQVTITDEGSEPIYLMLDNDLEFVTMRGTTVLSLNTRMVIDRVLTNPEENQHA